MCEIHVQSRIGLLGLPICEAPEPEEPPVELPTEEPLVPEAVPEQPEEQPAPDAPDREEEPLTVP